MVAFILFQTNWGIHMCIHKTKWRNIIWKTVTNSSGRIFAFGRSFLRAWGKGDKTTFLSVCYKQLSKNLLKWYQNFLVFLLTLDDLTTWRLWMVENWPLFAQRHKESTSQSSNLYQGGRKKHIMHAQKKQLGFFPIEKKIAWNENFIAIWCLRCGKIQK